MSIRSVAISLCAVAAMTSGMFARGGIRPDDWVPVESPEQTPGGDSAAVEVHRNENPDTIAVKTDSITVVTADTVRADSVRAERPRMRRRTEPAEGADTAVIFMKADWVTRRQIDTARVTCFTGNFAAHHNGTIITADSAIRYSDTYVECFGNVLINKNTTYIYGDRADYDSQMEIANVYSPVVKMVDGDATLYSYNFTFDTRDNVGTFYGGGMVINRENRLESDRGYYYADYHEVVCVERVEVDSKTYEMKGDSVIYNVETDDAYYFDRSNIWNDKGEYLYADRGEYHRDDDLYKVTSNGYILTDRQEVWSDSIDYFRTAEHAVLRRNIQIDDTEHKTLGFGDYGEYWGDTERAFLTLRPSIVNYDESQSDTLYLRSDSMYLYTIEVLRDGSQRIKGTPEPADEVAADTVAAGRAMEAMGMADAFEDADSSGEGEGARPQGMTPAGMRMPDMNADAMRQRGPRNRGERGERGEIGAPDESGERGIPGESGDAGLRPRRDMRPDDAEGGMADSLSGDMLSMADSLRFGLDSMAVDSLMLDSLAADSLRREPTPEEIKAQPREEAARIKAEKKAEKQRIRKEKLDRIAAARLKKLHEQKLKDEAAAAARGQKAYERHLKELARTNAKRAKKGLPPLEDTLTVADFVPVRDTLSHPDSLSGAMAAESETDFPAVADSLAADTVAVDTVWRDSTFKRVQCYRDVRIYRSDFQALCDSLVAFTSDSTAHMYIRPVLWNGNNQVTSEVMDIFTANQMITRAEFIGKPMMIAELDTMCYNQVAGKTMMASFDEHGQIYRNDVNGNVETVYYIQDSATGEITDAMYLQSGDATYYIANQQVETITYRTDATGQLSPLDMIPEDQTTRLQGFEWRGAERPDREDVFDREIRPSQRERVESLPRPKFPISKEIETTMHRLTTRGEWLDRVDVLSPEDEEWRRATLESPYK